MNQILIVLHILQIAADGHSSTLCIVSCCSRSLFPVSLQQFKARPSVAAPQAAPRRDVKPQGALTQNDNAKLETLHPSWAAKQQQKQVLLTAAPAGSKIVFNDNGQSEAPKLPFAAAQSAPIVRRPQSSSQLMPLKDESQSLHPSWVAKRAAAAAAQQAKSLAPQKAQKIVFDD